MDNIPVEREEVFRGESSFGSPNQNCETNGNILKLKPIIMGKINTTKTTHKQHTTTKLNTYLTLNSFSYDTCFRIRNPSVPRPFPNSWTRLKGTCVWNGEAGTSSASPPEHPPRRPCLPGRRPRRRSSPRRRCRTYLRPCRRCPKKWVMLLLVAPLWSSSAT